MRKIQSADFNRGKEIFFRHGEKPKTRLARAIVLPEARIMACAEKRLMTAATTLLLGVSRSGLSLVGAARAAGRDIFYRSAATACIFLIFLSFWVSHKDSP
jgi:hypothetical protein